MRGLDPVASPIKIPTQFFPVQGSKCLYAGTAALNVSQFAPAGR